MEAYFDRLWPIYRSMAGPGFRQSLSIIEEIMPTKRLRFETGSKVLDWLVPCEWKINEAYFIDPLGNKHADIKDNNLHLVSYSAPFRGRISLRELHAHLHTLPSQPNAIPYVTSYYRQYWGFCISHDEYTKLPDGDYEVVIDSEHYPGNIEVGEAVLEGETDQEILFSSYLCHPSLANNELSGPLVVAFLYNYLKEAKQRRYTYRFVIGPETIGAICFLSVRGDHLKRKLIAGYKMTCLGDSGKFTYKLSRRGNTLADRAAVLVLRDSGTDQIVHFDPSNGSDERQYCSPGYDLPVGSLMRTMYTCYPEYHTSLDNKTLINFDSLAGSVALSADIIQALESNKIWRNTVQYGEPQLGRRGLYPSLGSANACEGKTKAMMWLINLADGETDLLGIAEKSGMSLKDLIPLCYELEAAGLLEEVGHHDRQ